MNENPVKNIFKIIVSYILYYSGVTILILKLSKRNGLYVFNYHNFNTFANAYWKFGSLFHQDYLSKFEKQVQWFNKHFKKTKGLSYGELDFEKPYHILTFDDGYKTNITHALPILYKYRIPAIFFIVTGFIGTKSLLWHDRVRLVFEKKKREKLLHDVRLKSACKSELQRLKSLSNEKCISELVCRYRDKEIESPLMMDWDDVQKSHKAGIIIAPHTHHHPVLSRISIEQQKREISESIKQIWNQLKVRPIFFCFPDGSSDSFNEETIKILKDQGIRFSFTTINGINKNARSPYKLKRIGINPSDPVPLVALKIILAMRAS